MQRGVGHSAVPCCAALLLLKDCTAVLCCDPEPNNLHTCGVSRLSGLP